MEVITHDEASLDLLEPERISQGPNNTLLLPGQCIQQHRQLPGTICRPEGLFDFA